MRIEKSLRVPPYTKKRETLSLSELIKRGLVLRHLKSEGGALVLAEGTKPYYDVALIVDHIISSQSRLAVYRAGDKRLRLLDPKYDLGVKNAVEMEDYVKEDGTLIHYVLAPDSLYYFDNGSLYSYTKKTGGESMAVHKERVFYAHENTLNWSFLYPERGFKSTGTQESGELKLVDGELGNIVKVLSAGDELLLFRERGLMILRAGADTLAFYLENTSVRYPDIQSASVARCADGVYFFTSEGLFCYQNRTLVRLPDAALRELDTAAPITGAQCNGKYYASVLKKSGERHVYAYDGAIGCGRFIALPHVAMAARQGIYLLRSNYKIDVLSGSAFPEQGACEASFEYDLVRKTGGAAYLEDIFVSGNGEFEAEAQSGVAVRRVRGEAGKRLKFNGALRADRARIKITALSPDFALEGVTLGSRKEKDYGN